MNEDEQKLVEEGIAALTLASTPEREAAKRRAVEVLDANGITGWLRDLLAGEVIELRRTVTPIRR